MLPIGQSSIVVRNYPRGGALEDVKLFDDRLNRRDELDGRSAGSNHRHLASLKVVRVIPSRRVKQLSFEGIDAGNLRNGRLTQRAHGRDQDLRGELALRSRKFPPFRRLI